MRSTVYPFVNQQIYSLILSLLTIPGISIGQELSKHQWKDRVLLVFGASTDVPYYEDQLSLLSSESKGLEERRLVIYQILPDKYRLGGTDNPWIRSGEIYQKLMKSGTNFQVMLLGLDGGIKLRQDKPVKANQLFGMIDGMPMRIKELETRNKG